MKDHVLMVVENLPVPFDRRVWQEANALTRDGYRVTIICPANASFSALEETIDHIRILRHPLPSDARGFLSYIKEYALALAHELRLAVKVWRTDPFGIVHVANPPDLLFLIALPFKLLGVRFIFDHHDLTPELFSEKFGKRGIGYWAMRLCEWCSFKLANAVISTNLSYRKIAMERGGKPASDIFVVRSAPDLAKIKLLPPDETMRSRARIILGYVGIMGSQDGVDILLDILHLLIRRGVTDFHAVLIGKGPEFDALVERTQKLGLAEHITFTGYLSGDDLHRTMNSIDIGVCPDPYNEYTRRCTMNKIMEYMAFSKPVVQFDLDEGRFSAGEASLYAPPGDAEAFADHIMRLMDDADLRASMGAFGRRRVENELNWASEVPKLIAAYHHVLGTSGTPVAVRS